MRKKQFIIWFKFHSYTGSKDSSHVSSLLQ